MSEIIDYKSSIQEDFSRLDLISKEAEDLKLNVISKLTGIVNDLDINPNTDSPRKIEVQMGVVNSYVSLLDSYEKQVRDTIKTKQKHDDIESLDNVSELVTNLLLSIKDDKLPNEKLKDVKDDNELTKVIKENNIEISDGELESNSRVNIIGELKDDDDT